MNPELRIRQLYFEQGTLKSASHLYAEKPLIYCSMSDPLRREKRILLTVTALGLVYAEEQEILGHATRCSDRSSHVRF